jgi:CRP/FNR family transcriptional regulator
MNQVIEAPAMKNKWGIASVLSPDSFEKLKSIMYEKTFEKGAVLYWEGDPADKLYFIKSGFVRITKTTEAGRSITFYLHRSGDLFGQIDPYPDSRHIFNAEATERTQTGVIQWKDLEILLWQHGDFAIEFTQWLGLMNRMTQMKFRDFMMFGKPGALCSLLIRLSNTFGEPEGTGVRIGLKLNHSEIADMIGATRECVSRILGSLRKEGIVSVKDGYLVVENVKYLRDMCHCEHCPKEVCRV